MSAGQRRKIDNDPKLHGVLEEVNMSDALACATMLIRCDADQAFDAFVAPDMITRFWLKSTTGALQANATVTWEFLVPGATETVNVTACERPSRIAFKWLQGGLDVVLGFAQAESKVTVVSAEVRGFSGENIGQQLVDVTEGFTIVLCELKIFLESGRQANLVQDKAALIACHRARP